MYIRNKVYAVQSYPFGSFLILSSHPRPALPIAFFPSSIPTKTLYALFFSLTHTACSVHFSLLYLRRPLLWNLLCSDASRTAFLSTQFSAAVEGAQFGIL